MVKNMFEEFNHDIFYDGVLLELDNEGFCLSASRVFIPNNQDVLEAKRKLFCRATTGNQLGVELTQALMWNYKIYSDEKSVYERAVFPSESQLIVCLKEVASEIENINDDLLKTFRKR